MNGTAGVEVFFWLLLAGVVAGAIADRYAMKADRKSGYIPTRKWLAIKQSESESIQIPVRVKDTGKKELLHDLNIVRNTPFETFDGSYEELLATVTPEEADTIKEMREFLL